MCFWLYAVRIYKVNIRAGLTIVVRWFDVHVVNVDDNDASAITKLMIFRRDVQRNDPNHYTIVPPDRTAEGRRDSCIDRYMRQR